MAKKNNCESNWHFIIRGRLVGYIRSWSLAKILVENFPVKHLSFTPLRTAI